MPFVLWVELNHFGALRFNNPFDNWNRDINTSARSTFSSFWKLLTKLTKQELGSCLVMRENYRGVTLGRKNGSTEVCMKKFFASTFALLKVMWWVCVCRSTCFLLTNKSPPYTVILPPVLSNLFISVCEFVLFQAIIWNPSILLEKYLCSRSNTTRSTPRPDDALTHIIANSTREITKFSIAVKTASCTLFLTVVIKLSASSCTLLTNNGFNKCLHIHFWSINLSWINCLF